MTDKFVSDLGAALNLESANAAPELAQAVLDLYRSGETASFAKIFQIVEHHLIHGTQEDQQQVIVGFLENLKNFSVWNDLDYAVFEEWIGPESFQAWRWLEKKWQGKRSLASAADESREHG